MILEIRAGAGGHEAALWTMQLARMYQRYAQAKGWKVKQVEAKPNALGGYKEIHLQITCPAAASGSTASSLSSILRYEAGVHRVQRVPKTESAGRIHTSTATVAVLPEPGEDSLSQSHDKEPFFVNGFTEPKPSELKIETFRSGGPGGQHANKVETGIRITHLPTGISVESTSERSQYQNKQVALALLKHKLQTKQAQELKKQQNQKRREQVGTAERAEKIRTYNFPQNRVTDHRLGKSWHSLESILNGELDKITTALLAQHPPG